MRVRSRRPHGPDSYATFRGRLTWTPSPRSSRPGWQSRGGRRVEGGRLFELRDGVWVEASPSEEIPLITVKLFSRAWFDLVAALPEVTPAASELGRVELAGTRVRLRFDQDGLEQIPPDRLTQLIADFRGVE